MAVDIRSLSSDTKTISGKQASLVSGTNIKTINGTSILGSGDLTVSGSGVSVDGTTLCNTSNILSVLPSCDTKWNNKQNSLVSGTSIKTVNGSTLLGSGDIVIAGGGTTYAAGNAISLASDIISVTAVCDTKWSTDTNTTYSADGTTACMTGTVLSILPACNTKWNGKQDSLVSGTSIKTINGTSIMGSGDLVISGGGVSKCLVSGFYFCCIDCSPVSANTYTIGTTENFDKYIYPYSNLAGQNCGNFTKDFGSSSGSSFPVAGLVVCTINTSTNGNTTTARVVSHNNSDITKLGIGCVNILSCSNYIANSCVQSIGCSSSSVLGAQSTIEPFLKSSTIYVGATPTTSSASIIAECVTIGSNTTSSLCIDAIALCYTVNGGAIPIVKPISGINRGQIWSCCGFLAIGCQVAAFPTGGSETLGTAIASSATTTIGGSANSVHITGTTTITSFGTGTTGKTVKVIFDGALILTHNATSLILSTGNITTAAGDSAVFLLENGASGYWRMLSYTRKNGAPLGSVTSATCSTIAKCLVNTVGSCCNSITPLISATCNCLNTIICSGLATQQQIHSVCVVSNGNYACNLLCLNSINSACPAVNWTELTGNSGTICNSTRVFSCGATGTIENLIQTTDLSLSCNTMLVNATVWNYITSTSSTKPVNITISSSTTGTTSTQPAVVNIFATTSAPGPSIICIKANRTGVAGVTCIELNSPTVKLVGLPTSSPGISGTIWNNNGVLNIVP